MLGITGGIASGKSTVSARLRELGAFVADADIKARLVMQSEDVLQKVRLAFGNEVFFEDGALNRRALAAKAFASPEGTARLNSITHPAILAMLEEDCKNAEDSGLYPLAVIDAALLIESGAHKLCKSVWLVTCGEEERIERIMLRDDLSREEALSRIKRQMPDEEKAAFATRIIRNDGSLEELIKKVDAAFAEEIMVCGSGIVNA